MRYVTLLFLCATALTADGAILDTIGVTSLRQVDPTLNGSGVKIAQVEGSESLTDPNAFEVIPGPIGQPTNLFIYYNSAGSSAGGYPNTVGSGSSHATSVGGNFYGTVSGVATNVSHVDNYEAGYFYNGNTGAGGKIFPGTAIPAAVVNQSFNFLTNGQTAIETKYDNYVVAHKTLFLTGAGNNGSVSTNPPATCFNGIAVGVSDSSAAVGPTSDGRSKPDIVAPGGVTSFSTPYVSGSATILWQAAARGDGGSGSSFATNPIAVKALLLNGAIKPADWTNGPARPLDARYGAGVVNVFNSWNQLKGGLRGAIETNTISSGGAHPPGAKTNNEASLTGWDYTAISTTSSQDQIKHYYFNLTGGNPYTFTSTLVWNRQQSQTRVNNLDLFLYSTSNSNLVVCSTSAVDNVEHLFLSTLSPGRYDLQVMKRGSGQVSSAETYALAFEMFSMKLNMVLTNGNAVLSWSNSPTGFRLVSSPSLISPVWATVSSANISLVGNQNVATVPLSGASQFCRLQRP